MNNLTEILNSFIKQSNTNNLKTLDYPKSFLDLKMKTSFGQGNPARVSWISFLAPEMRTSEGFYPVYLFYKKENKLILAYGISETSEAKSSWPEEILSSKTKINDYLDKLEEKISKVEIEPFAPIRLYFEDLINLASQSNASS